ncbi:MAG: GAF domain-containing protein [Candidatus Zixiibacteriota bacterium]
MPTEIATAPWPVRETEFDAADDRVSRVTHTPGAALQLHDIRARLAVTMQSADLRCRSGLGAVIDVVRQCVQCRAVAIRLIDQEGHAPFEVDLGFPEHFCSRRNLLSLSRDRCLCTQVLTETVDPECPGRTPSGSLVFGTAAELRFAHSHLPDQPAHLFCPDPDFASMALVPVRGAGFPLGLIHCADPRPHHFHPARIAILEAMAGEIGRALFFDSIWPSPWTPSGAAESPASCPMCGRLRVRGGWEDRAHRDLQGTSWSVRPARHVLCPHCLASQVPI